MNDYDDSEDYSSGSSFRARSNTWPLNRPDLAVPNSVCIDETLPEIELEEDELFTTNENWATGLVDHDIMSWDPFLNAQSQHHHHNHHHLQQPQQHHQHHQPQNAATVHHHHHHHQPPPPQNSATVHHHHQQQPQQQQLQQPIHQTIYHQPHDNSGSTIILNSSSTVHQQLPPQSDQQQHCLTDDPTNEYHIQQLHHLHLDNHNQHHQHHLHYLTSPSLDNQPADTHGLLSSSLSTSGFNLGGDLEDLDYKAADPSTILPIPQQQQPILQGQTSGSDSGSGSSAINNGVGSVNNKQSSSSTTSSKTKLNTPRRNAWGNMSYADLISQAINSTNDKRLTLSQIYDWMVQHVPYFKDKGDSNSSAGWKNSVRHNLSLHNRFKRLQNEGTGKSSWWTINPEANIGKCARRRAASMEASKYEKKRGRAKKRADAVRQGLVSYPSLTNSSLNGSTGTLDQQLQIQSAKNLLDPLQQSLDGLNSYEVNNGQLSTGLYVATSQQSLYDEEDKLPQQQQQLQASPTTTPPLQITSVPLPPPASMHQQQPEPDRSFYCYTPHNHYIRPQANVRTDLTAD